MLAVQKFLQHADYEPEGYSLDILKEAYGIKYTINEEYGLVVLNYCQIDSPKLHQITKECRSLVLEMGTWEVVSRSFDRFLNIGEGGCADVDWKTAIAFQKIDGSLIGIFAYKGQLLWRTRSMIKPATLINGNIECQTWDAAMNEAVDFTELMYRMLNENGDVTLIGELTCKDNRVVTKYDGPAKFWLHAIRTITGGYMTPNTTDHTARLLKFERPKRYEFSTATACALAAKELRDLQEGYVIYSGYGSTSDFNPLAKVKNPAYVAAHHIRGNDGLTERRVLDLLIMNEVDEYVSIFPEDEHMLLPLKTAYGKMMQDILYHSKRRGVDRQLMDQKQYAMKIKHLPIAALLFKMRAGVEWQDAWKGLTRQGQYRIILSYKEI